MSVEKCRDGIVIQISRNKNKLFASLMGSPRLATRRNRTLQAEVNMPSNLSVSMSMLIDILAAGVEEGYTDLIDTCQDFARKVVNRLM